MTIYKASEALILSRDIDIPILYFLITNMRLTLIFSLLMVSLSAQSQDGDGSKSSLFLLKIDSTGAMISNKVAVSSRETYGYYLNRMDNQILVHGFIKDSIAIDSISFGVGLNDSFPGHVILKFDSALKCSEIQSSNSIPVSQPWRLSHGKTYWVSMIADSFRFDGQSTPNVGKKDVQVSVYENGTLAWNQIFGTIHNDVPYSIYYDSVEGSYYVTGFISEIDTTDQEDSFLDSRIIVAERPSNMLNPTLNDGGGVAPYIERAEENEIACYIVHPNPFSDYIDVKVEGTASKACLYYQLYASNGISVSSGTIGPEVKRISGLSNLPPGTYYLSIQDASKREVKGATVIKK